MEQEENNGGISTQIWFMFDGIPIVVLMVKDGEAIFKDLTEKCNKMHVVLM